MQGEPQERAEPNTCFSDCFCKLFVSDIFALVPWGKPVGVGKKQGYFKLNRYPISCAEVVGVLVGVHYGTSYLDFNVDDGTGTIQCSVWRNREEEWQANEAFDNYNVGDLVCVQGKIQDIRERRKINVYQIRIEQDPNAEALHWLQVMKLQKDVYSK